MCGILGIAGPSGADLVGRTLDLLSHRGPDDRGVWSSPELTLGHRRLTIIGLEQEGRQPMISASGHSVITFNGEIYNYLELADRLELEGIRPDRRFDTAVLLAALETWGLDVLSELNGMFAFGWYRLREGSLVLARDRWGKKPLFWGWPRLADGSRALMFSSELRTFAALPGGPPEPDPLGVARYLVYDGMPGRTTVYRGVTKVPAASWIELDPLGGGEERCRKYWELRAEATFGGSEEEAVEDFTERLDRALALRLRSDVPVGLFLSGGIDSSLLAARWRALRPEGRIATFTAGFADSTYDERASARLMANQIGAEHHEIVVTGEDLENELDAIWGHLSEPFADPSIIPVSLLCRRAREHVTVALGGDGADELQAGYDPFRAWRTAKVLDGLLPRSILSGGFGVIERMLPADPGNMSLRFKIRHFRQGFLHPPEERIQGWMAGFPLQKALAVMDPDLLAQLDVERVLEPTRSAFRRIDGAGDLHAQIQTWSETYLECSILAKVDRASMMHSLEVRAPYLDPNVAELLLSLPPQMIEGGGKGKSLMRLVAQKDLPTEILSKPKKGLGVPQATWLRTVLRERMEQCLTDSRSGGWFRAKEIDRLWQAHLRGRADYRRALWTFLFAHPFQANEQRQSPRSETGRRVEGMISTDVRN